MHSSHRFRALAIATVAALTLIGAGVASAQRPHTVQPGETLSWVAAVNGLSVEQVAAANGLSSESHLIAGSVIQIPTSGAPGAGQGSGQCVWDCASTVHPHLTDERVDAGVVGEIAANYGMSSTLVEAIAEVESGYSNAALSSADARGVMQIIPDTWEFVDGVLTGETLDPVSARANIEAGVIYLRHLYRTKGGDRDLTIGSYFQGPNRDGLLPETRNYIDLVTARQDQIRGGG